MDLILVHRTAASDHLGDADKIALRTGAPVVCGGDVKAYLKAKGVPGTQIQATIWGVRVAVAGFDIFPVECHHWSQIRLPDGQYVTGVPMGFIVEVDPGVRFYHYGDTAIFSDLKLMGELFRPNIGALGMAQPTEILHTVEGPARDSDGRNERARRRARRGMAGSDFALPCHYLNSDNDDVREFNQHLETARSKGRTVPRSVLLETR